MNGLLPRHQSAYRQKHSTETAMLRVWSDILTLADVREVAVVGLLDLSVAFDCIEHDILLNGLEVVFDLTNTALQCIRQFRSDIVRTVPDGMQQVLYCGSPSPTLHVPFGVPQGSVLGPLLYVPYTLSWSRSSCAMAYFCTCMLTTAKCTSVLPSTMSPWQLASSLDVLQTSVHG